MATGPHSPGMCPSCAMGAFVPARLPVGEGELATEMSAGILLLSRAIQCCPRDPHESCLWEPGCDRRDPYGSCPRDLLEVLVLPMGFLWDPSLAPITP